MDDKKSPPGRDVDRAGYGYGNFSFQDLYIIMLKREKQDAETIFLLVDISQTQLIKASILPKWVCTR
jgi:hypothetical protein